MIVYFHRNPVTYEIFYVGIGVRKWRAYDFKQGRNPYWKNYVSKYGIPVVQIVHYNLEKEKAHYWERFYIKLFGRKQENGQLTNLSEGGDCAPYIPIESRMRSINALLEWCKNNPEKNAMKRPEIAAKHSGVNNPMKRSDVVEKVRKANIGKKHSADTRLKQSLLKKGVRNIKRIIPVIMINATTGQEIKRFDCIVDALLVFGKPKSGNISQVCKGQRNKAFGYKWEYAA